MYFCNNKQHKFLGDRSDNIYNFMVSGWGCVRKKDIMTLFDIPDTFFPNIMRYLAGNYDVVEEEDYFYISVYPGQKVSKKYMNALSVLIAIAAKNMDKVITITDNVYSSLFVAKMFIEDSKSKDIRTYYVIDTALVSVPFYALEDVIKAELSSNGFEVKNKLIIIVYEDTELEYIDLKCQVFYAMHVNDGKKNRFRFYDNKQFKGDE